MLICIVVSPQKEVDPNKNKDINDNNYVCEKSSIYFILFLELFFILISHNKSFLESNKKESFFTITFSLSRPFLSLSHKIHMCQHTDD